MSHTILITGAAKRIGRAMAAHFAAQGWHVAAHYDSAQAEAQSLQKEINISGGHISLFQADFTQDGAAQKLFENVVTQCGAPDVLINNAARFERDEDGITEQSLHKHMAVNATAPMILAQLMRTEIPAPTTLFNMLDRVLDWSWPHLPAYVLSKLALEEWTKRNAPQFQPTCSMFGLRLGPTLRHPRESEAHFEKAATTQAQTSVEDILAMMQTIIKYPAGVPCLIDV
jgi:NAD(P)-dependent dehydrogenase (short-subunit alcohol dehydrogenase family)